jgi:hypothetical protein
VYPRKADQQKLQLPKATAQVVVRATEKNKGAYLKLAEAFEAKDWDHVEKIANDERKEFEKVSWSMPDL